MSESSGRLTAFNQSLLARQLALVETQRFVGRYPHAWLVWTLGPSSVQRPSIDVSIADTKHPSGEAPPPGPPLVGDAICFALKAAPGAVVRIGRALENDLVVSDLSVSRLHARLELSAAGWTLATLPTAGTTRVREAALAPGSAVVLSPRDRLSLGDAHLVFYDAAAFCDWLRASPLSRAVS
ncbi:MAG: FHA domain-containing protein [Myxococcaceae bacterium]|nr:FHA domain-containing protein [Myxococcaceae bacterium]